MRVGWLVDMGWWLGDPLASLPCSSGLGFLKTLMGVGGGLLDGGWSDGRGRVPKAVKRVDRQARAGRAVMLLI